MAVLPVKAILDTSVYLSFLRQNGDIQDLTFLRRPTLLYLSSVVFAELYAGARDRPTVRLLERFYRTFDASNRVIVRIDKCGWRPRAFFIDSELGMVSKPEGSRGFPMMS
jgi:hypothetical protein